MKIYEIVRSEGDSRFCHPYVNPESDWIKEKLFKNSYKKIHELPIPYLVDNRYEPDDYLVSKNEIFSSKAGDILSSLNKNITLFESQFYYNDEKIWDIYFTVVFPKYSLFNYEKSVYESEESCISDKVLISSISKLVFDKEKVNKIEEDNFFTMEEKPTRVYCTEKGKQAIEAAGLIGIAFEEIPAE